MPNLSTLCFPRRYPDTFGTWLAKIVKDRKQVPWIWGSTSLVIEVGSALKNNVIVKSTLKYHTPTDRIVTNSVPSAVQMWIFMKYRCQGLGIPFMILEPRNSQTRNSFWRSASRQLLDQMDFLLWVFLGIHVRRCFGFERSEQQYLKSFYICNGCSSQYSTCA